MENVNLQIGEKYTVLLSNDLVPTRYYGELKGYYYNKFAQFDNALYLFIKRPRAKNVDRIVVSIATFFIFKGNFKDIFRKELVSQNEGTSIYTLHRFTYDDLKDNANLIYYHEYGQFNCCNSDMETFIERTADFLNTYGIRAKDALANNNYIEYVRKLLVNYNLNDLKQYIKDLEYDVLYSVVTNATSYNW